MSCSVHGGDGAVNDSARLLREDQSYSDEGHSVSVSHEETGSSPLPSNSTVLSSRSASSDQNGEELNIHRLLEQCSLLIEEYTIRSDEVLRSSSLVSSSSSYSSDYTDCSSENSFTDTESESLDEAQFDHENPSRHLYDAHLPLIQFIDFNPVVSDEESSKAFSDGDQDASNEEQTPGSDAEDVSRSNNTEATEDSHLAAAALSPQLSVDSREQKICIQCCAWPDVQKYKGILL